MTDKLAVPFEKLRASGGISDQIGRNLRAHVTKAVKDMQSAAGALHDWSFGGALESAAAEWKTALEEMCVRIAKSGQLLTDTANGQQWTDAKIFDSFLVGYERRPPCFGSCSAWTPETWSRRRAPGGPLGNDLGPRRPCTDGK